MVTVYLFSNRHLCLPLLKANYLCNPIHLIGDPRRTLAVVATAALDAASAVAAALAVAHRHKGDDNRFNTYPGKPNELRHFLEAKL